MKPVQRARELMVLGQAVMAHMAGAPADDDAAGPLLFPVGV